MSTGPGNAFARRRLSFAVTRRELLLLLRGSGPEPPPPRGLPALSLADLGHAPDQDLAELVPRFLPGCELSTRNGQVHGCSPWRTGHHELFPATPLNLAIIREFDGRNTLAEIARRVRRHVADSVDDVADPVDDDGLGQVRTVFLALVQARLAIPS